MGIHRLRWPSLRVVRPAIAALGLAACASFAGACDSTTEPVTTFWEGNLSPVLPATVTGRVVALTQAGRTQANIVMEGGEPGVLHTWRISTGTCASEGTLQGGAALYTELLPSSGGSASGNAALSELFRSGQTFAARVFRSPEGGVDELVACGSLQETEG
jgi:hypothetical protein